MSHHPRVPVYREGHFSHFLKHMHAERKVSTGAYRYRPDGGIEEITLDLTVRRTVSPHWHDPKASFTWAPRPSACFIVMQAKWRKQIAG